jgi:hypothetical protein
VVFFFGLPDIGNPVQTGIEVQIRDDYGKTPIDKNFCGSIYDIKEVSENRVKKPGKWNQLKLICDGSLVEVYLNNKKVVDIDLSDWEEAGKNPDGTKNKFNTAYKDMARKGKIGFQDHGGKVWFRKLENSEAYKQSTCVLIIITMIMNKLFSTLLLVFFSLFRERTDQTKYCFNCI